MLGRSKPGEKGHSSRAGTLIDTRYHSGSNDTVPDNQNGCSQRKTPGPQEEVDRGGQNYVRQTCPTHATSRIYKDSRKNQNYDILTRRTHTGRRSFNGHGDRLIHLFCTVAFSSVCIVVRIVNYSKKNYLRILQKMCAK